MHRAAKTCGRSGDSDVTEQREREQQPDLRAGLTASHQVEHEDDPGIP